MTAHTPLKLLSALLLAAGLIPSIASAQSLRDTLLDPRDAGKASAQMSGACRHKSQIQVVNDITFEGVKVTGWNFGVGPTGFDPTPALSTTVSVKDGCFNAHLSVMTGSNKTYGGFSPITLYQVRMTQLAAPFGVFIMDGHYPTCYGFAPCVALSAEYDVDMLAANFFKVVSSGGTFGSIPPGGYKVDVLWTGGPAFLGGAGAIGAAFTLKTYHR